MTKRTSIAVVAVVFVLAVAFVVVGLLQGEAQLVFAKAARICLECIGIG
ncbi:MAG: thioredoxin [Eggerthellaceae bacterium]|nr:thioredoxin [Eggerthellaceae bacterium]